MAKKIKVPCIRGLSCMKNGCPMKPWDGEEGCPAWVELLVTPEDEPLKPKDKQGNCVDMWNLTLKLRELALLEGNQRAIESFRNNMSVDGSPKPDPALYALAQAIERRQIHGDSVDVKMVN
jgi:hypothetical protein